MKKVLLIIALIMVSLTLKAVEPVIKFYLEDGNSKEYNIEDITDMNFVKSYAPYLMEIYKGDVLKTYNIRYITSLEFMNSKILTINFSNTSEYVFLEDIDSIIFIPNVNDELTIGSHNWMGKNLDVDHYRNGDLIPQVTDSTEWKNLKTGAWCYYKNDPAMGANYGKLYNWYAVSDPRGLTPEGWHIPNQGEWKKLADELGGDSVAGGKLKSTGTLDRDSGPWESPNLGATNETYFSANPGGYRYNTFLNLGLSAIFWTSTEIEGISGICTQTLSYDKVALSNSIGNKFGGYSVRCIKDYIIPKITAVSKKSSLVGKELTIWGSGFGEERKDSYVAFGNLITQESDYISWSDTEIKLVIPQDAKTGYLFVWSAGYSSNYINFTITTTDPDYFEPITIGTQVWMSRNLNVDCYRNGDTIQQVKKWAEFNNLSTGAWCYYYFKDDNEELYGKLYNWFAVNDPRGLAPEGWHIASDEEWTTLTNFLGDTTVAGGKMKTTGNLKDNTGLWKAPNFGATNESGFSALPAGKQTTNNFQMLNFYGYWWTSSEADTDNACFWQISNMSTSCSKSNENKRFGLSVRCIKD